MKTTYKMYRGLLFVFIFISSAIQGQEEITGYRYWIDNPWNKVEKTLSGKYVSLEVAIDIPAPLSLGIHTFGIQFKDNNDKWTPVQTQTFLRQANQISNNKIVTYEYGFDDNAKTTIDVSDDVLQLNALVDVTLNLSEGLHSFKIRAKDALGVWSSLQTQNFIKLPNNTSVNKIVGYEYGFDNLEKVGVNVFPTDTLKLSSLVNVPESLADGLHSFYLRSQDALGNWTTQQTHNFIKLPNNLSNNKIVTYEYWFDTLEKESIDVVAIDTLKLNTLVNVPTDLVDGLHSFHLRAKDALGKWTHLQVENFIKVKSSKDNKIIGYKYWFDGFEDAKNEKVVTEIDILKLNEDIIVPVTIPEGEQTINYQFKDKNGHWSGITSTLINVGYTLPEKVNLTNLDPDLSEEPMIIYPGGTMHRYFKITDESNKIVRGAIVNYKVNNKSLKSSISDDDGIVDLNIALGGNDLDDISDDIVSETQKEYSVVFLNVSKEYSPQETATILNNDFDNLTFLLKDFDQVLKSQGISLGTGISTSAKKRVGIAGSEVGASAEAKALFDIVFIRDDVTDKIESIDVTIKAKANLGLKVNHKAFIAELGNDAVINAKLSSDIDTGVNKDFHFGVEIDLKVHRLTNKELKLYFLNLLFKVYNKFNDSNILSYRVQQYLSNYLKEIGKDRLVENTKLGSFYGFNNASNSSANAEFKVNLNDEQNKFIKLSPPKKEVKLTLSRVLKQNEGVLFNFDYFFNGLNLHKTKAKTSLYLSESNSTVLNFGLAHSNFGIDIPIFESINYDNIKKVSLSHIINVEDEYKSSGNISVITETAAQNYSYLGQDYFKSTELEYQFGHNALITLGNQNSTMSFFSQNPVYIVDEVVKDITRVKNDILNNEINTTTWDNDDFSYQSNISYHKSLDYDWSLSIFDIETSTGGFFNTETGANAKTNFSLGINWGASYPVEKQIYLPKLEKMLPIYQNLGVIYSKKYIENPAKSEVKEFLEESFDIFKVNFTDISDAFKEKLYSAAETIEDGFKKFKTWAIKLTSKGAVNGKRKYTRTFVNKNETDRISVFEFSFENDATVFDNETVVNLKQQFSNGELKGKLINDDKESKFLIISDLLFFNAIKNNEALETSLTDFNINVNLGDNDFTYFGIDKDAIVELFYSSENKTEWKSLGVVSGNIKDFKSNELGIYALGTRLDSDDEKPIITNINTDILNNKITYRLTDNLSGINWSTLSVDVDGSSVDYNKNENEIEISFPSDDNEIHVFDIWVEDNYGNIQNFNETIDFNTLSTLEEELLVVQFYPNPIKDKITISSKEEIKEIIIYNALSQKVFSSTPNSVKINLDLSEFKQGVYIVKLKSENSYKTYSIIKN